ncbi:vertnin [Gadus macrocephalus]|uniref:vertnin n=1 Tax=Gadus macrocephalus TaxID=80720 RepID=UPI0028CBAB61|nr:vertnin [Gadus macrocephalus]XP_059898232.1 vertnin [Gadus macrocephalus]
MIQRKEVVLSVLGELQEATESSGLDALTRVAIEVQLVLAQFQLPSKPCQDFPEWTGIDEMAHSLFPADAPSGLLPLNCKGEGNLLFDAASMLLVGSTRLSLELQVRTVLEMLLWKRYYLCGMIDSKIMLQAARFSLCAEESEDMLNLPVAVLEAIFDADVKASCFAGSYANMWHVYALSSVLHSNIYSIYPMFNPKIRPYFNRLIRPRTCHNNLKPDTLHIMWSGMLQSGTVFKPNNFVALVKTSDLKFGPYGFSARQNHGQPNQDSPVSYTNLKDKNDIGKRTLHRWTKQTEENCQKSTARYKAKHFLQASYLEGKLSPLQQFKEIFPEISRSTYYNWKHELVMGSGVTYSATSSAGEVSPESTEQETWSSPEPKQEEPDHHESVATMFGLNLGKLDGERAQNVAHMQEAKRCLQNCIAMNTSLPFRFFKRNFPGISRSTYYNWRREAILFHRGYKTGVGSSEEGSDADKSQSPKSFLPHPAHADPNHLAVPRVKICRRNHKVFTFAYTSKKQLRDAAKIHVQESKWSLAKFKLKYPSMSPCFFWRWRNSPGSNKKNKKASPTVMPEPEGLGSIPAEMEDEMLQRRLHYQSMPSTDPSPNALEALEDGTQTSLDVPFPRYPLPNPLPSQTQITDQMFVMDVVALANFKAKAKLFLQQRFEEKAFPTFKEFRSYFPFTPRSTYYMWKRALHHGVSLVHG